MREKSTNQKIGDRLRKYREKYEIKINKIKKKDDPKAKWEHVTQSYFDDIIGIGRETMNRYESGRQSIKAEHLILLADEFEVSCEEILRDIKPEYAAIYRETGLTEGALEWLANTTDERRNAVNILFAHPEIANDLIDTIIMYMLLYIPGTTKDEDGSLYEMVSRRMSDEETLFNLATADYIHKILWCIRNDPEIKKLRAKKLDDDANHVLDAFIKTKNLREIKYYEELLAENKLYLHNVYETPDVPQTDESQGNEISKAEDNSENKTDEVNEIAKEDDNSEREKASPPSGNDAITLAAQE